MPMQPITRTYEHRVHVTPSELGKLLAEGCNDEQAEALRVAAETMLSWGCVDEETQLCYIGRKLAEHDNAEALDMLRRIVEFADSHKVQP